MPDEAKAAAQQDKKCTQLYLRVSLLLELVSDITDKDPFHNLQDSQHEWTKHDRVFR